ncbi:MAG: glycosyltransferase family 4 protein [Rhizobiaceae bacterium]|nr:glycosyltransferase family 4 protein [Rhizobiaceae bacterium]
MRRAFAPGHPRICLDASMFRERLSGIGYYSLFLMEALLAAMPEATLSVYDGFSCRPLDEAFLQAVRSRNDEERSAPATLRQTIRRAILYAGFRTPGIGPAYRVAKHSRFRSAMKGVDLFHALNFLPPCSGRFACLPTVHDLSVIRHPETHPAERVKWMGARLSWIAAQPWLNTVSNFSAGEIADVLGVDPSRIGVTYPGLNPVYAPEPEDGDAAVIAALGLHAERYFIAVGTIEPRKNLAVLLGAFAALPASTRREHPLVVLGQPGWGKTKDERLQTFVDEGSVRILGYRNETTVAALYRNALTLLFPSIYEGFGMPTVEAMASGLRPVLSDVPVMREVGGSAADFVHPHDASGWRLALEERIEGAQSRYARPDSGAVARAGHFGWDENARRTADLYRRCLLDRR